MCCDVLRRAEVSAWKEPTCCWKPLLLFSWVFKRSRVFWQTLRMCKIQSLNQALVSDTVAAQNTTWKGWWWGWDEPTRQPCYAHHVRQTSEAGAQFYAVCQFLSTLRRRRTISCKHHFHFEFIPAWKSQSDKKNGLTDFWPGQSASHGGVV